MRKIKCNTNKSIISIDVIGIKTLKNTGSPLYTYDIARLHQEKKKSRISATNETELCMWKISNKKSTQEWCQRILAISVKIIGIRQNTYHALITLASNHIFSALALSSLLIADLRYRAISMALTGCKRGEERRGKQHTIIIS